MTQTPLVLSLEQGLSLPHATQRMVRMGWRVIRLEMPLREGVRRGDPNRFIGPEVGGEDLCAYFIAPNVGKESLAIDLSVARGQELLCEILTRLDIDVFCCNTLPRNHAKLGIDAAKLQSISPSLIWASLSAWGLDHPSRPGYDPAMQGELGFMSLTGEADGIPLASGVPMIDLLAGEQLFTAVLLALWKRDAARLERSETATIQPIDISMARCAVSWLPTKLPLPSMGVSKGRLARSGNRHPMFGPVNTYPTRDGWAFLANGSDDQWRRLLSLEWMSSLDSPSRSTNEGRILEREEIDEEIAALTSKRSLEDVLSDWRSVGTVAAPINEVEATLAMDGIAEHLFRTRSPTDVEIPLPPSPFDQPQTQTEANDHSVDSAEIPFPPHSGEQTNALCHEAGFTDAEIEGFREENLI